MRLLIGDLPDWAHPKNPLLRYQMMRSQPKTALIGRLRWLGWGLSVIVLVGAGYYIATNGLQVPAGENATQSIWQILVIPLIVIQVVMRVVALSIGANAIAEERRKQTWDNLRATENGAEMALRTRWVAVLYRLRGWIGVLMLGRLVLAGAILYELTSFHGSYLDILAARSDPAVSVVVGIVLLAALLTAIFVLPITGLGVDVALGLLISTGLRNRALAGVLQVLAVVALAGTTFILVFTAFRLLDDLVALDGFSAWLILTSTAAFGDWGLSQAQLTQTGDLWMTVPHSIFIGAVLLAVALLQVLVIQGMLAVAIQIAERRE